MIFQIFTINIYEPGFAVDERIKQATIDAITNDRSHYAESQGETDLRIAAVAYFNREYHLNYMVQKISSHRVSEAINVIFQTLLNDNDGLLVPEPAYGPIFLLI